jgi:hypothetical protein
MNRRLHRQAYQRSGVLKIEAMVACVVLIAAMNFASKGIYRINHLWNDTHRYQFAINELSNQMEVLSRLSKEDASIALESLSPSAECKNVLGSPKLDGETVEDEFGTRVTLKLSWLRPHPKPPELTGWLARSQKQGQDE